MDKSENIQDHPKKPEAMKILIQVEYTLSLKEMSFLEEKGLRDDDASILKYVNFNFLDMSELDSSLSKGLAIGVIRE